MPEPLVYVDGTHGGRGEVVAIGADDDHHLRTVLRLSNGDRLIVGDGRGRLWAASLDDDRRVILRSDPEVVAPQRPLLHVLQALPKGRKLDAIVRSLVELGVERITPVSAARSVVRLSGDRAERARERWEAVALAAAAQARRAHLPTIDPVLAVDDAVAEVVDVPGVAPHVGAREGLRAAVARIPGPSREVAVAIGPEGGWTDAEVARWVDAGLAPVSLGRTVLRTEHAAFATCAALSFALGRMDAPDG